MNDVSTWKKICYDQISSKRRSDVSRTKKKRRESGAGCIIHEYVERRINPYRTNVENRVSS